jgi:hypothetical protein
LLGIRHATNSLSNDLALDRSNACRTPPAKINLTALW